MISEQLGQLIPDFSFETLVSNERYGFKINLAQLTDPKSLFLYTEGLSEFEQPIDNPKFAHFNRLELYFSLPDFWNLEDTPWPLEWLEKLAMHPKKNDTWFGPGDTISISETNQTFTHPFPATHLMLTPPILMDSLLRPDLWESQGVHFFAVVPIAQLELDYKLRNSATVLTERLIHKGYTEQVDIFRQGVCRKRILGLF